MESTLMNLSDDLAAIVEDVGPQIVSVCARRHYPASGIRWNPEVVLAADHAIQREEDITVSFADGNTVVAELAGRDPGTDLAVLKVPVPGSPVGQLRRAAAVKAGELALVVGRSPDSGVNASLGIVSAVSGPWRTWRGGQMDGYIRLDARLFPQSSGGAVVNVRGELIGLASPALSRIAGLAVPVSTIAVVAEKLLQKGFVPRGYLGVGVQPVPLTDALRKGLSVPNQRGLIVLAADPGGPADKAGILIGDILVGIGDVSAQQPLDLQQYSDSGVIGKTVRVRYIRGGELKESPLTVEERPGRRH